ncbi:MULTISPECIES: hypothetical protein [Sorangium]|uniref:hypothetical protein n=1 Tax=Sorangium TaxID=39643 RepID=UPI003D9C5DAF
MALDLCGRSALGQGTDVPELAGARGRSGVDQAAAPSPRSRSSPAPVLSTGVQSPAPDVALDLRARSELAGGLLYAVAAPRSTRGCGVEPAFEELGVAIATRPDPCPRSSPAAAPCSTRWTATAPSSRGASTWRR